MNELWWLCIHLIICFSLKEGWRNIDDKSLNTGMALRNFELGATESITTIKFDRKILQVYVGGYYQCYCPFQGNILAGWDVYLFFLYIVKDFFHHITQQLTVLPNIDFNQKRNYSKNVILHIIAFFEINCAANEETPIKERKKWMDLNGQWRKWGCLVVG